MAAEPVISPVPICEACWMENHARWEPESMDKTGRIIMRLKGVDVPIKLTMDLLKSALCVEQ